MEIQSGLGLIPNEVVGYRFEVDSHNVNVVLVKKHGPQSKFAGQEYTTTLAHCRNVSSAARWLIDYVVRNEGQDLQAIAFQETGSGASIQALIEANQTAKDEVMRAIEEFSNKIKVNLDEDPKKFYKLFQSDLTDSSIEEDN